MNAHVLLGSLPANHKLSDIDLWELWLLLIVCLHSSWDESPCLFSDLVFQEQFEMGMNNVWFTFIFSTNVRDTELVAKVTCI